MFHLALSVSYIFFYKDIICGAKTVKGVTEETLKSFNFAFYFEMLCGN